MQIMQCATMSSLMEKAVSPSIANFFFPHPHSSNASTISTRKFRRRAPPLRCSDSSAVASTSLSPPPISTANTGTAPPVVRRRMRYRKQYPGESKGITEEMRFVAMKLRNINGKKLNTNSNNSSSDDDDGDGENDDNAPVEDNSSESDADGDGGETETWRPSLEGFIKYLVDSKLVFDTVERIVDESNDVACEFMADFISSHAYFRKTGLERSESLSEDLEWFKQQGNVIPEPSNPGVSYAKYLERLAEESAPLFLCHFYNIYFSHIAGGQVIARQVSEKLLEGRELAFCAWEEDVQELLKGVREKLNKLGEHWTRDDKNKCLKETTKSFRYLGQIVRLIILELK
ncbi:probable inactive heme oxygenase 2, chloroplastic isoform X2 [Malus sylvestris]|uniref:probable inactive heme oxygenase 2, chloroplastic isoform X2 n=1 Tax=Malus sylvestris TaxID=3752 RepID=UPI0021AC94E0|nr:probable inactive heme oxygenase 2, chloroplastic isoform X2 [Malus sylvestris]